MRETERKRNRKKGKETEKQINRETHRQKKQKEKGTEREEKREQPLILFVDGSIFNVFNRDPLSSICTKDKSKGIKKTHFEYFTRLDQVRNPPKNQ